MDLNVLQFLIHVTEDMFGIMDIVLFQDLKIIAETTKFGMEDNVLMQKIVEIINSGMGVHVLKSLTLVVMDILGMEIHVFLMQIPIQHVHPDKHGMDTRVSLIHQTAHLDILGMEILAYQQHQLAQQVQLGMESHVKQLEVSIVHQDQLGMELHVHLL
jgi:hypothetical protein